MGVAGLHRLMSHMDSIMNARVIIAIAGMEGALASVIGGLADCPGDCGADEYRIRGHPSEVSLRSFSMLTPARAASVW